MSGPAQQRTNLRERCQRRIRKNKTHLQAKAQILILACHLLLTSTSLHSRDTCFLQSQIRDKDIQCTVLNGKPSGHSWLCLALQLVRTFLSNSLKAMVMRTVTNGFPSVTSVLQHLVFKMFFHDVLFKAPSPSPGGDEKVILIFKEALLIIVQACA